MELSNFISVRPFLYHLTAEINVVQIEATRRLDAAASILEREGNRAAVRNRRKAATESGSGIVLRDQAPLHPGHCELEPGWKFEDLVELLNRHVFFWPGTSVRPIEYGLNHFARYSSEEVAVLRFRTEELFAINAPNAPLFSRVNSGAPRTSGGKRSKRGAKTFLPAEQFVGTPSDVVEVVFRDHADLPVTHDVFGPTHWRLPGTVV